jgi:hypothetical protein
MKTRLQNDYKAEYEVLRELFGAPCVDERIDRLNTIHDYTESLWRNYIEKIPDKKVKYLLIAESPPWSQDGIPQYFLDPNSRSRSLMNAFRRAFFPNDYNGNLELIIDRLAKSRLLLIDSIPFSMNYSGLRSKNKYKELVGLTVYSYMLKKLSNYGLKYMKDMRIVFGYQINAINVINALGGILKIKNYEFEINKEMICTNAANYPDANFIRKICRLTTG